jgi:DNA-binding CsgD family transcriptional regulator
MSAILDTVLLNGPVALKAPPSGVSLDILSLLMDELAYGIVIANLGGQVLHANQAAVSELARSRILGIQDNLLLACAHEDQRMFLEALARAGEGKRSLIHLGGEGGKLTLALVPLRNDPAAPRVALLFARAAVYESLMLCFFARSHGLTATEEHVLGILCLGHSTPDIAKQMKVAVSTIRSHVRSLCAKTQSSGVRELVNRVAVLPPVAPAVRQEQVH